MPTDPFTTQVSPALDLARAEIQKVGLRPHRVFMVTETWSDTTRRRSGTVVSESIVEVLPTPKVHFPSATQIALSGGMLQAGSCELRKISRVQYTEPQLLGKDAAGADFAPQFNFFYAVKPLGTDIAEFYYPSSEPVLQSTSYALQLHPLNKRGVLSGITPDL